MKIRYLSWENIDNRPAVSYFDQELSSINLSAESTLRLDTALMSSPTTPLPPPEPKE